jgi:flagellar hook-associated protein 2
MSSVYGYYSSSITSSGSSTSLGVSGLVSGLDTDSIVEAMTSGTTEKISKVQQNLMKLEWKQEAYQDVGTALTDFKSKYLSSSSSTSISSLLANCYNITSQGSNASAVTASGSADIISDFSILGVTSLASTASYTSGNQITKSSISSGKLDFSTDGHIASTVSGKTLSLKVGSESYSLEFDDTVITDSDSLLTAVQNAIDSADNNLSDKIEASISDGKLQLTTKGSESTSNITVTSASNSTLLKVLGLQKNDDGNYLNGQTITGQTPDYDSASKEVSFFTTLGDGDKSMTLDLDGTKATINFDTKMLDAIQEAGTKAADAGEDADAAMLNELKNQMQSQISKVYGDKVSVNIDTANGSFSLESNENNSILSVASGSSGLVGSTGVLGIEVGAANRLLTSKALESSNFKNEFDFGEDGDATYDLDVNGVKFTIGKNSITVDGTTTEYSSGVTMKNVMTAINGSSANVKMSYLSTTDRFTISSTVTGAAGTVSVSGSFADMIFGDGNVTYDSATKSYISNGSGTVGENSTNDNGSYTEGTDAKILVSFDGKTVDEITRSSNSFKLDGLSLNLSSTFNTDKTAADFADAQAIANADGKVTFNKSVDSSKLIETVTQMVEDYNNLIDKVVGYYTTKQDSDYQPLTSDMIEDEGLTDDQAELYNNKAKEGILFGDSILRTLTDDMRKIFTGMSSIGITTSSDYTEYGKLSFDSDTFKSALESDTESVTELFTNEKTGALSKLDSLMTKYVNSSIASPGLITAKAGLASSSLSQTTCTLYSERQSLETQLSDLQDKLSTQEDRYYSQFTNMEVQLQKIQNQSSYLSMLSS